MKAGNGPDLEAHFKSWDLVYNSTLYAAEKLALHWQKYAKPNVQFHKFILHSFKKKKNDYTKLHP